MALWKGFSLLSRQQSFEVGKDRGGFCFIPGTRRPRSSLHKQLAIDSDGNPSESWFLVWFSLLWNQSSFWFFFVFVFLVAFCYEIFLLIHWPSQLGWLQRTFTSNDILFSSLLQFLSLSSNPHIQWHSASEHWVSAL